MQYGTEDAEEIDTRNEDEVIASREEAKEHYSNMEIVKENASASDAIFDCFKSGNPLDQISALNSLTMQSLSGNVTSFRCGDACQFREFDE